MSYERPTLAGIQVEGRPFALRQGGGFLVGDDVSKYQVPAKVDWSQQDVAIVRAAYATAKDATCGAHANAALKAGVPLIGAYLFVVQTRDPMAQLAAFRAATEGLPLNVAPTIDLEDLSKGDDERVDTGKLLAVAQVIHAELVARFGQCMVYTGPGFALDKLKLPQWLAESPLWLAHYTTPGHPVTWGIKPLDAWCGHQWRGKPLDASVWRSVPLIRELEA